MPPVTLTLDGNEAAARVAYALSEAVAIYPITPSSSMGEWADQWASEGLHNLWGSVPTVVEMQSEAGVAGALHGALQAGALATTFTASQGLLLMIPNMFKIAGELTPMVMHVAARSIATHALSIFGDHSDVMAARMTGWAMLCSANVQEAMDLALISHSATLESRIPFLHFFDGFRTSHEVAKVEEVSRDCMRAMIDEEFIRQHRHRGMSPDRPGIRGTAQNPDVFFQGRERANSWYNTLPAIVQERMDKFAELTGRQYHLFDYVGAANADRVLVIMGSGGEAALEAVERLAAEEERVGVLRVRLYRPFAVDAFLDALPPTVKAIAVLDRTKEPGATGEPLYQDVMTAINEAMSDGRASFETHPRVIGGRYGLSSKEFTPAMVKAVFDELKKVRPKNHFTVGIVDDVTHTSLFVDTAFSTEDLESTRAIFWGLGSDGTVGANKNTIKIIGEETDFSAQGYFVYDSKKSGSVTTSHLRFGPKPIRSTYLISRANFVACHQFMLLDRLDVLEAAEPGAIFLLNSPHGPERVWEHLPVEVQKQVIEKGLRLFVIDAYLVAREAGMGGRINTIMQTCFFAISGVLPGETALECIQQSIEKSYGKRGEAIVQKNLAAVQSALDHLHEARVPAAVTGTRHRRPAVAPGAPEFVQDFCGTLLAGRGDTLPVSAMPIDGAYPCGTAQYEKRNIAQQIPVWDPAVCIQCGKCVLVCPHAVIRSKLVEPETLNGAPAALKTAPSKFPDRPAERYILQVSPEDCTGCALCVEACPAKNKQAVGRKAINMSGIEPLLDQEVACWDFFRALDDVPRESLDHSRVKDVQLLQPLFEFSGACAGCGETPYLKLLTQLLGDRLLVANATGCSSIYGGNLPTTPWSCNSAGRGPAWANSLFEDNAEFGLGMRVGADVQAAIARELLKRLSNRFKNELVAGILDADQSTESGIEAQRARVAQLMANLEGCTDEDSQRLASLSNSLVHKSVWIIGGDGWAYDIGYGGLDHVLSSGKNVKVLVLDTEVYSNTGGQQSKSTPRGAVAKFAAAGKPSAKKDLALLAMSYGNVYVARVAFGANDAQTIKAFREAEAYNGPALIIAYSHCIAHGFDLVNGLAQQKAAVASGHWPLVRFNPERAQRGETPLELDCKAPSLPFKEYAYNEARYRILSQSQPDRARELLMAAQDDAMRRWDTYSGMAANNDAKQFNVESSNHLAMPGATS